MVSIGTINRILKRVEISPWSQCWLWNGGTKDGYAQVVTKSPETGRKVVRRGHRLIYEHLVGPVPDGLDLDHLCRNRECVNPAHLEPVPRGENVLRGATIAAANKAKTHCSRGHVFDESNTYVRPVTSGVGRMCRTCNKLTRKRLRLSKATPS